MREDGELTELKVEEKKQIIKPNGSYEDVQYSGHVDAKGDVTGWGRYFSKEGRFDIFVKGTFLDRKREGIVLCEFLDMDTAEEIWSIQEYHNNEDMRRTTYCTNGYGKLEFYCSRDTNGGEIDYPYFSGGGKPLEAYYKVQEFD